MEISDYLGLLGGLAMFLYGMRMMSDGLELVAGSRLKSILEKLTRNRFLGMLVGLFITAIVQSSNAITAMTIGFVNVGLMDLSQAIGVIMGSNIGTTVTGQILALNVSDVAPVIAFIGVVMYCFSKKRQVKNVGQVLAGLGILFLGMGTMSSSMAPLKDVEWFRNLMVSFKEPILGILAGAVFTAVIQSSSASVGILQAMAMQGIVGLDNAIFVLCGQNIGCTIAAVMAAIGGNKSAKRTALVHILFNVFGTILMVCAVKLLPLTDWIVVLTPDNPMAQIANAHTLFNVVTTIVLLPCANLLAKLTYIIIPGEDPVPERPQLMHITEVSFGAASIAIGQVEEEVTRMEKIARHNLGLAMDAFFSRDLSHLEEVHANEETLDFLNKEITKILIRINAMGISQQDAVKVASMYHIVHDLERIGDHAENIAGYANSCHEREVTFSETAMGALRELSGRVFHILDTSYDYFCHPENNGFDAINDEEDYIDNRTEELEDGHIERLKSGDCTADAGMIFVEILTDLERVADHALNIAEAAHGGKKID